MSLSVIVASHEGRDDVTVPRRRDWEKGTSAVTNRRIVPGFLHLRQLGEICTSQQRRDRESS